MSRDEFALALERHALELESSLPLCTTRIEHIRVTHLALEARRLLEIFNAAATSAA